MNDLAKNCPSVEFLKEVHKLQKDSWDMEKIRGASYIRGYTTAIDAVLSAWDKAYEVKSYPEPAQGFDIDDE